MKEKSTASSVFLLEGTPPAPARKLQGKPGRPKGGRPDETRDRILNAAESLFADRGYDGASIRDVAAAADVQINAVGYHFGPKEDLFDTVIARRAAVMEALRLDALADARRTAGEAPIPVEILIRAYVRPFIESADHGEPGWRNYAALMGRLANSPLGTEIIARHYDDTARTYLCEFQRTLLGVELEDIVDGFSAMVAAMLGICAKTGRRERLANTDRARAAKKSIDVLVRFHAAGFNALSHTNWRT